jgi:hypothetical protein
LTTITLTPSNASGLAWAAELTGLSLTEIVNLLLEDLVDQFDPESSDEFMENKTHWFDFLGAAILFQSASARSCCHMGWHRG